VPSMNAGRPIHWDVDNAGLDMQRSDRSIKS
jgi:hypothetical protein